MTSLAQARRFWVDLLGFVVTHEDSSSLYLRGYDELTHHNLILRAGPVAAAGALGFRVRSGDDLSRAEAFYGSLGCRTSRLPAGTVRGLGEAVRVEDPLGFCVEFFASSSHPQRLQQRYDLRRGAEVARLDHFNICVPDVPAAYSYYSSLGFGLSETIEDEQTLYAAWMYRKQTVHDVAFTGRRRAAAAPPGVLRARAAQRAAHVRHPRLAVAPGVHRARPWPARRVERLLRLPA